MSIVCFAQRGGVDDATKNGRGKQGEGSRVSLDELRPEPLDRLTALGLCIRVHETRTGANFDIERQMRC